MAELRKGVLSDEISEKDIDKETLASAEIDGVSGGSGAVPTYSKKPCENKRPDRRPSHDSYILESRGGLIKVSDSSDDQ